MTKLPKFKLIRLGSAKRLTRGLEGAYSETGAIVQKTPGM